MKILVLSDSHSGRSFMRFCIDKVRPDHVVHLGDHYEDGQVMAEEYPHIRFHLLPGNCDRYRMETGAVDIMYYGIGGVRFFMTHGHKHCVKSGLEYLLSDARSKEVRGVLFGHTHEALCCYLEQDDMWVLNPGSCGSWGGSAGVIQVEDEKITACYIVKQADLEEI